MLQKAESSEPACDKELWARKLQRYHERSLGTRRKRYPHLGDNADLDQVLEATG